jgi:hypothetical protein
MQIGDKVQVVGTVRDLVGDAVLLVTDDNREYWLKAEHVQVTGSQGPIPETPAPAETPAEVPVEAAAAAELPPE